MNYPKVFVITLNWNKKIDTLECLESLNRLKYPNYEIVVVDNGSEDGSAEAIKEKFANVHLIENKSNLGYAIGFNIGIEFAYNKRADFFMILNNDTIVDPKAINELIKVAQSQKDIGFVSGKVYYYNDPKRLQTVGRKNDNFFLVGEHIGFDEEDIGQYDMIKEYDFIDDVFLLVKKEVWEKIGGYDKSFYLHWEETDWCARARRSGFRIFYAPNAKIWHKGMHTVTDGITPSAFFFITRNQIPFMWRNVDTFHFLKFTVYLVLKKIPTEIMRFIKYKKISYIFAFIRGIGSGYLWIIKGLKRRKVQ